MCLFPGLLEPPPWLFSLLHFPSPLVMVVPVFGLVSVHQEMPSWFADHCWTWLCRDLQAVSRGKTAVTSLPENGTQENVIKKKMLV